MKNIIKTCLMLILVSTGFATEFSVQGVLRDPLGRTVVDGDYSVTFKIYDEVSGSASALWTGIHGSVDIQHGIFTVLLGGEASIDESGGQASMEALAFNTTYWIGISVEGGVEMFPRTQLTTSPYSKSVFGTDNVFPSIGNIGVGTLEPNAALHIISNVGDKFNITSTDESEYVKVLQTGELEISGKIILTEGSGIEFSDGSTMVSSDLGGSATGITSPGDVAINAGADGESSSEIVLDIASVDQVVVSSSTTTVNNNLVVPGTSNLGVVIAEQAIVSNLNMSTRVYFDKDDPDYYLDPHETSVLYSLNVETNVRAPILYDKDDADYFIDPASTSTVNELKVDKIYDKNDTDYFMELGDFSVLKKVQVNTIGVGQVISSTVGYNAKTDDVFAWFTNIDGDTKYFMNQDYLKYDNMTNFGFNREPHDLVTFSIENAEALAFSFVVFGSDTYADFYVEDDGTIFPAGGVTIGYPNERSYDEPENSLDNIMNLNVVSYVNNPYKYGLVTSQVQEIFPELVEFQPAFTDSLGAKISEDFNTVNMTGFIAIITQSIKELKIEKDKEVQAIKEDYDKKVSSILARLESLENQ